MGDVQNPYILTNSFSLSEKTTPLHTVEWGMILHSQTSISNLWIARLHSSHYTLMPIVCNNLILFQDETLTAFGKLSPPPWESMMDKIAQDRQNVIFVHHSNR